MNMQKRRHIWSSPDFRLKNGPILKDLIAKVLSRNSVAFGKCLKLLIIKKQKQIFIKINKELTKHQPFHFFIS